MSVDILQEKIRKTKNPSVLYFEALSELVPTAYGEGMDGLKAYFSAVMEALKGVVPAVRFGLGSFALWGEQGLCALRELLTAAKKLGYYILLDAPELMSAASAFHAVQMLFTGAYEFHGVVAGGYAGSDVMVPLRDLCKKGKSVFIVARTSNKSAVELQDLLAGGRLVHVAVVDLVARHGDGLTGKCGYSNLGAVAAASSAASLKTLRPKYNRVFMLLDGFDYPNSNAKNCSFAFDKFGHGAAACACAGILGAWKEGEGDAVALAVEAAERMKKNLTRYFAVL